MTWGRTARDELTRSLPGWLRRKSKEDLSYPGRRDYLWLCAFLCLITSLLLLGLSFTEGLVARFSDSLLGRIEGAGVPVRVLPHPERVTYGFDREIVDLVADQPGLRLVPTIQIFDDDPLLGLPDESPRKTAWQTELNERIAHFDGIGVSVKDPLWWHALRGAGRGDWQQPGSLPLTIILDRARMAHLDLPVYGRLVREVIPDLAPDIFADVERLTAQGVFWLWIGRHGNRRLLPVEAIWADSLPGTQNATFFFPLETHKAIELLSDLTDRWRYYPEGHGASTTRYTDLVVAEDRELVSERLLSFEACHGSKPDPTQYDPTYRFWSGAVAAPLLRCLERANLSEFEPVPRNSHCFLVDHTGQLQLFDTTIGSSGAGGGEPVAGRTCGEAEPIDSLEIFDGLSTGNVYLGPGQDILDTVDRLMGLEAIDPSTGDSGKVFALDPSYAAALERFDFLVSVLDFASRPVGGVALLALTAAVALQIIVIISHRRQIYGMMLADGVRLDEIRRMVQVQFVVCTFIGWLLGVMAFLLIILAFDYCFQNSSVAEQARTVLGLPQLELFPLAPWMNLLYVLLGVAIATLALGRFCLWQQGIRKGTMPTDLIH